MNIWIALISGFVILLGTAGALLPILPGIPLSLAVLWFYGFYTNFQTVSIFGAAIFSFLTLLTILLDVFAPALGAKGYKSSKWGVIGAILGGIFGIFIMGPVGALVGPLVGGFIGEFVHAANAQQAMRAAVGAFIGMLVGSLFKLVVGISMFVYFILANV